MRLTSASLSGHRPVSWSTGQQWQNQGLKGTSMADWSRIWNLFTSNFVWKECLVFPQASQGHVTSVDCKCTLSQDSQCRITGDRWDVVWEMKHWGLQTLNIIILYLFFYKINKGDLPLMYSCVLWEEFIELVVFWLLLCVPCHSSHNNSQHSTLVTWAWDACAFPWMWVSTKKGPRMAFKEQLSCHTVYPGCYARFRRIQQLQELMEAELTMIEQKRNKEKVKKVHNRHCYKQLTLLNEQPHSTDFENR